LERLCLGGGGIKAFIGYRIVERGNVRILLQ